MTREERRFIENLGPLDSALADHRNLAAVSDLDEDNSEDEGFRIEE